MIEIADSSRGLTAHAIKPQEPELWAISQAVEATFLAEMLKASGLGKSRDMLGGGVGEEHFSSLLVQHQADAMSKTKATGLAETIYSSLIRSMEGQ